MGEQELLLEIQRHLFNMKVASVLGIITCVVTMILVLAFTVFSSEHYE